jgi:hypothetical protein
MFTRANENEDCAMRNAVCTLTAVALLAGAAAVQATVTSTTVGPVTTYTENFNGGTSFSGGWFDSVLGGSDDYLWLGDRGVLADGPGTATWQFTAVAPITQLSLSFWYAAPNVNLFGTNDNGTVTLVGPASTLPVTAPILAFDLVNPGDTTLDLLDAQFTNMWTNLAAGTYTITFAKGANSSAQLKVDDLQLTVTAVPEPGSMALALAGLGVVGALSRRRRSR